MDEPPLTYDLFLAIDGGNSLKRFANAGSASNMLAFSSDYFVSREDVEKFARPVKESRISKKGKGKGEGKGLKDVDDGGEDDEHEEDTQMELSGDGAKDGQVANEEFLVKNLPIGEGADEDGHLLSSYTERWKANADDVHKKAFNCFEEAGVSICLCRHGHVFAMADMVSSGEL